MVTAVQTKTKMDTKNLIKWLITLVVPLSILLIPTTEAFTWNMKKFIAITLWGILMFIFEHMNNAVPSILMMFAYIASGVAGMDVVFGPWTKSVPWMMLGCFVLVNIVQRTTVLNRIAYWCIIRTGGTYTGLFLVLYF